MQNSAPMKTSKLTFNAFHLLFVVAIAIGLFQACIKDQDFIEQPAVPSNQIELTNPDYPDEWIRTNVFGLVVDENENPVANSQVSLKTIHGDKTTTTDEKGGFIYNKVTVWKNSTVLKVRQTGKFEAFRKMNVTADSYNYTKIKLLNKTIAGVLPAIQGGTAEDLLSSAKVELPSNGIRQANGEIYTGGVGVVMDWIDPTAEDLADRMVGDLSGIDENGRQVALQTFGMLNVELLDEDGEELQLEEGKMATLSFPVPDEIIAQAPPTIPLWSFDEELGTWVEEGTATLENGFYVGEVSHFSSWNVDWKGERIRLRGEVLTRINSEDIIAPYLHVLVTIGGMQQIGGFLDDSGEFEFYNFPADEVFTLSVLGACGEVLWEEELGPFASNTELETIVVLPNQNSFTVVAGVAQDCDGNVVMDGYVEFDLNNASTIHMLEEDGSFEFVVNTCDDLQGEISLMDLENKATSLEQTVVLSSSNNFVNVGFLMACDELPEYLEVTVVGQNGEEDETFFFDESTVDFISAFEEGDERKMRINGQKWSYFIQIDALDVTEVGVYEDIVGQWLAVDHYIFISETTSLKVTKFAENSGESMKGTFEGEVTFTKDGEVKQRVANGAFKSTLK